ncbi:hypothetical protein BBJ29_006872 [Phytophthora kernoviae]|uniref:NmrA-like domain-containing protein n=1 Tax=Phytophthora kernoviae TaxID=325452 RepID=A0A3F2RFG6_9STRA|nr:hypothetical protein BBJ29_006872 [Phytophthora kernoviae]RLN55602.1 hypothetical protein BBP00_00008420 [Phytophthora kernoviae]
MPKFVLMGAGGNLGGAAADFAIEIAKPDDQLVFASSNLDNVPVDKVKRWQDKGVEVVSADYDDLESMKKAFKGAEAVATISTWLIGDRRRSQIKNAIEAAKATGVKRFCYTSGAGKGEPNTVYEITGCEPASHEEIFEFMSSQSGYKGELVDLPNEELEKWWLGRGLPKDVYGDFSQLPMKLCIGDLLCSGEMVANGCMLPPSDAVEKLTGRKPTHWKDAMIKYKDIFPKTE